MTCVLSLHHGLPKKSESDFSSTHSLYRQKRKPLCAGYPSVRSETMVPPNSMGGGKCRGLQQFPLILENFHSSLSHWNHTYLHFTSFIGRILPNSHLVRLGFILNPLEMPITTLCDDSGESDA